MDFDRKNYSKISFALALIALNKIYPMSFNALPYNRILDLYRLKAFADDKINVTQNLKFILERVENIVGKGENACYKHFLLLPQYFQSFFFRVVKKSGLCGKRVLKPFIR